MSSKNSVSTTAPLRFDCPSFSSDWVLIRGNPSPDTRSEDLKSKKEEKKVVGVERFSSPNDKNLVNSEEELKQAKFQLSILRTLRTLSRGGDRYETTLVLSPQLKISSSAGKYNLLNNGADGYNLGTNLLATNEWTAFNAIFDDVFVQRVRIRFDPVNKHSGNSTASASAAGSPGQMNTVQAVIVLLWGNQATYTDASTAYTAMASAKRSRVFNTGDTFHWAVNNPSKLDWNAPSVSLYSGGPKTTGWMNVGDIASLGCFTQHSSKYASGAAAGIGDLLESGLMGDHFYHVDLAFRMRS